MSAAYLRLALEYGAGKPTGTFNADSEKGPRGLQILLTRPLGTDPMADEISPPSSPANPIRDREAGALERVAAALTSKKPPPQPQRTAGTGHSIQIDGQHMEIL